MKVGDRVVFFSYWSSHIGKRGTVTRTHPGLWVVVDGERIAYAVPDDEVMLEPEPERPIGGAE